VHWDVIMGTRLTREDMVARKRQRLAAKAKTA
jgi:hypothetical protein